ncbi:MAG: LPS export ABC transporter periplasmic protein LptC, partial [Candidatus Omnitrophota bacterium]
TASIDQKILSFNLEGYRDNGEKKWELEGSSADIFARKIKLHDIVARSFGRDVLLTLKASEGTYDRDTQNVRLQGNVVGRTSDGAEILTDSLDWKAQTEEVRTDSPVRFNKDNITANGMGMVAVPDAKRITLNKDVIIQIAEDSPTTIKCDGSLRLDYIRNIATFMDAVVITDKRAEISSDKMKVLFDPDTRRIRRAVAIGNVRILQGQNATYSDRAIYTTGNGKVRFIGKPRITVFAEENG